MYMYVHVVKLYSVGPQIHKAWQLGVWHLVHMINSLLSACTSCQEECPVIEEDHSYRYSWWVAMVQLGF